MKTPPASHPLLFRVLPALLAFLIAPGALEADVKLPALISNGMVLEKSAQTPVWGKADPGEEVRVTFNGQTLSTQADPAGKWRILLNLDNCPPGPLEMTVEGKNKITINDVLVGEVWIGSGQSNMGWTLKNSQGSTEEIARSANPLFRHFLVKQLATAQPQDDTIGSWVTASPETSGDFSAVGYYFAQKLQKELQVPVGLVNTSWGGTPSEAWTSMQAIDSVPALKARREQLWPDLLRLDGYAQEREAYVSSMKAWTTSTGRADKPTTDAAAFAGESVPTTDWVPVEVPGSTASTQLPATGAIWLRRDLDIPTPSNSSLPLVLPIDGFDTIYWNGQLLAQTTFEHFPGKGAIRRYGRYAVPQKLIKPGKNTIAIRLYQPVEPSVFTGIPKAGTYALNGTWLAKAEYTLPDLDAAAKAAAPRTPVAIPGPQHTASSLFNGMVQPVLPLAISGVIWYQGESNAGRAHQYRSSFPLLINDWRNHWQRPDLPFYFCQLANFMAKKSEPGDSGWAELREAQSMTLSLPHTAQAVLIDIGEADDIHPRNKKDVGERLARIALARDYGKKIVYSGPVYESLKIDGDKAILSFRHTDGGLVATPLPATHVVNSTKNESAPLVRNSPESPLEGFAVCGADGTWVWANARIEGQTVIVQSAKVPAPVAVRYAWADNPTCNLANGAGLPASPFRTDDFPLTTLNGTY